jgi:PAS domain S-box-containing protein
MNESAGRPLRILFIEDNPFDLELLIVALGDYGFQFQHDTTQSLADLLGLLAAHTYDLILSDYNLPGFDGLTALRLVQEHAPETPFILVSGAVGEEIAIESLKAGATDYVLKDRLTRLGPVVKRALQQHAERQTRIRAEQALRLLNQAVEQSPVSVVITDASGAIQYVNPKFTQVTGYEAAEVIGQNPRILQSGAQSPAFYREMWDALTAGEEWRGEFRNKKKSSELYWEFASIAGVKDDNGAITHFVAVKEDISQRKQLEEQQMRQERLAAVGQLAAGIAHDFNNILAAIGLYAEIVGRSDELGEGNKKRMAVINQQVWHASRLIGQILDFSRRSVMERRPLDLRPLVKEQVSLLKRTLPESITIELVCGAEELTVAADPTRMQQVITNLAVNARDAMPNGGRLRVELNRVSDAPAAVRQQASADAYIRLRVSDTGTGIAPEALAHIFEPFFTTKAPGEGTGLGLAQIHGIVGQHQGHIDVVSEVGSGTTFTVYLPALAMRAAAPMQGDAVAAPQGHGERVLVVEDEAILRDALVTILEQWNYRVAEAADGIAALAQVEGAAPPIDVIITDVVMPVLGGVGLVQTLWARGVSVPVILLSGHPLDRVAAELQGHGVVATLSKPPDLFQLAQVLTATLANGHQP